MSRTLRLLPELIKGPAVRTTGRALEFLAGKPFEQRVTNTVTCCSITVASVRTFERRMGLISGAGHVGPCCGGDAGPVLAREARVALEAFAQTVLPTQALLVAAVGALGPCQGEEYQIAHRLCMPPRRRAGGSLSLAVRGSLRSRGQLRAGQIGLPASGGRRRGAATRALPPFALDQRPSRNASVLHDASCARFCTILPYSTAGVR